MLRLSDAGRSSDSLMQRKCVRAGPLLGKQANPGCLQMRPHNRTSTGRSTNQPSSPLFGSLQPPVICSSLPLSCHFHLPLLFLQDQGGHVEEQNLLVPLGLRRTALLSTRRCSPVEGNVQGACSVALCTFSAEHWLLQVRCTTANSQTQEQKAGFSMP